MQRAALAILLAASVGCGGAGGGSGTGGQGGSGGGSSAGGGNGNSIGAAFDREALSGTRLKTRYLQGEDGSRAPMGFFDTTRNVPCSFSLSEDGQQRCLPAGSLPSPTRRSGAPDLGASVTDSTTGIRYGAVLTGATTEDVTYEPTRSSVFFDSLCTEKIAYSAVGCGSAKYAFEVINQCPSKIAIYSVTQYSPPEVFFTEGFGLCRALPVSKLPGFTFYRVGAKVPASSFVGATVMVEP